MILRESRYRTFPRRWASRPKLTFGQDVEVAAQGLDQYGRTIGRIRVGGVDVNAELVRAGSAWVFRRYSHDPELRRLEAEARAAERGLWGLAEADRTAPWEWRAAKRRSRAPP